MRPDRWLIIRDAPGEPLLVLGAAEDYEKAQHLFREAQRWFDRVRIVPHADRVAELLLTPDDDDERPGQPVGATTQGLRRMTALALLQLCAALGAQFWLAGPDELRVYVDDRRFPLTEPVMTAIRAHEREILDFARRRLVEGLWHEVLRGSDRPSA
ncbi:MAG TPA: hypothetical protein VIK75_05845 [Calditerricola sp.]